MRFAEVWRPILATFLSTLFIYVANHATDMHIAPWLAAIIAGLAATIGSIISEQKGSN